MPITLGDLAKLCGLTRSSVSQILNGRGAYSPTTCARVRALAAEHNYRANASARAIRAGRIGTVGMVIPENPFEGYIFHGMLCAMERELSKHDRRLAICAAGGTASSRARSLIQGAVDGIIINHHYNLPIELEQAVSGGHLPAVWINAKRPINTVLPDDRQGVADAVAHLIAIGHRKIAYLDARTDPLTSSNHPSAPDRANGYLDAMRGAGLPPRLLSRSGGLEHPHGMEFLRAAWRSAVPTAVMCYDAQDAMFALVSLAAHGLEPLRDVCVVAIHDVRQITPYGPLPTWLIDGQALGCNAVDMLLAAGSEHPNRLVPMISDRERCVPPLR